MKFLAPYTSALAFSVAVGLLSTSPFTSAHSWLECTDYQFTPGSDAARVWDPLLCHGRARCGRRQMESKFGADTGFNIHTSAKCQCERGDAENQGDRKAPVASYTPGQRVCLAYPPKNHVADGDCTNANIPDSGVRITRTAVNPTSDDPKGFIKDYEQGNGKHVNGQVDYKGFQNCPNFCQNKEGALCTMCFDLENDIAPGEYTFKWIWAFNSADDEYSSCWEATIGSKDGAGGDENKDEKSPESPSPSSPQVSPTPSPTPSSLQVTSMSVPLPSSLQASPTPSPTPSPSPSSSEPPASDEQLDMPESPSSSTGSDIDEECEEELDVAGSTEGDELEIPGDAEAENGDGSPTPATTMPAYQGEVGAEGGNDDGEVDDDSNCEQGIPIANTRAPGAQGYSHDSNANQMPEAEVGGEADDPDANSSGSALDEDENCEHGVSMADTNAPEPAPEGAAGADATLSPEATPDTQDGEDDDCSRAHPGGLPYSYPLEKQKQYQNGRVHPDKS